MNKWKANCIGAGMILLAITVASYLVFNLNFFSDDRYLKTFTPDYNTVHSFALGNREVEALCLGGWQHSNIDGNIITDYEYGKPIRCQGSEISMSGTFVRYSAVCINGYVYHYLRVFYGKFEDSNLIGALSEQGKLRECDV